MSRLEAGDLALKPGSGGGSRAQDTMPPRVSEALARELSQVSVESMTPLDALNELARLRDRAQESREH